MTSRYRADALGPSAWLAASADFGARDQSSTRPQALPP